MQRKRDSSVLSRTQASLSSKIRPSVSSKTHALFANKSHRSVPSQIHIWSLLCTFSAICALLATTAFAQELPAAKPETVGMSSERLERIGKTVQQSIDEKRIAGAVTLVMRRGRVVWFKPQGMMDREANKAMRPDTIFRICSMSKPITSVAVMMLYEEGHFLLDDPISKYLPEFKNPKVLVKPESGATYTIPAKRQITIRDLLRHTSGLTYHWNDKLGPMYAAANVAHVLLPYDGTIADSVQRLAGVPLLFNPEKAGNTAWEWMCSGGLWKWFQASRSTSFLPRASLNLWA